MLQGAGRSFKLLHIASRAPSTKPESQETAIKQDHQKNSTGLYRNASSRRAVSSASGKLSTTGARIRWGQGPGTAAVMKLPGRVGAPDLQW